MEGEEYWETLDKTIFDYINHPESKYENGKEKGEMKKRKIKNKETKYIGKETKNIEEGIEKAKTEEINKKKITELTIKERKKRKISRQRAYYWRKSSNKA